MKALINLRNTPNTDIPLITGCTDTLVVLTHERQIRETQLGGEVVAGAAAAIVSALKGSPKKPSSVPVSMTYSPNNQANLRRKNLEDLRTLHSLYEEFE